ncbi:hypothetical protein [Geomicrobium sediminis]|uniref:Uncharacterized protein n=1 Tax=Geomicrobium sediminis TaxID=1347788 RepID=A0ABS2PG66_9BACL|nr:hypothetical protein [Geomicrobium sediminis]MBM7634429.1 hypothetical protein [Geomicrobium sediminis]
MAGIILNKNQLEEDLRRRRLSNHIDAVFEQALEMGSGCEDGEGFPVVVTETFESHDANHGFYFTVSIMEDSPEDDVEQLKFISYDFYHYEDSWK